jgi:hypothetical protein
MTPEEKGRAMVRLREARAELTRATEAYRKAMRAALATGWSDVVIAGRSGMNKDAVRMARKRQREQR